MTKISVIGAGNLGSAIAYVIASRGIVEKIILVDILPDLAQGQMADIQQALPFKNKVKVCSGNYDAITGSAIIIITAGKPRTPDIKDRLELATINVKIIKSVLENINRYSPHSIIITVTNPMDIINHFIYTSGFSQNKVIGSGGQLDSARLKIVLGSPEQEVEAYILGEHGENQVPIFSRIKVDDIQKYFSESEKKEIKEKIKQAALMVIQKKGATIFAPASHTADMVEAIVKDQKKVLICSANLEGEYGMSDVSLDVPCILGKDGIEKIEEWGLDAEELQQLQDAGKKLKEVYEQLVL